MLCDSFDEEPKPFPGNTPRERLDYFINKYPLETFTILFGQLRESIISVEPKMKKFLFGYIKIISDDGS